MGPSWQRPAKEGGAANCGSSQLGVQEGGGKLSLTLSLSIKGEMSLEGGRQ